MKDELFDYLKNNFGVDPTLRQVEEIARIAAAPVVFAGRQMRAAQKRYFSPNGRHPDTLRESKRLEGNFDTVLELYSEPPAVVQAKLFE